MRPSDGSANAQASHQASEASPAPALESPNILIVIADDMGIDTMSAYAPLADAANTPTLDALAADGVLFENAWATPACATTRAALISSQFGIHTGVVRVPGILPRSTTTLQSFIKEDDQVEEYGTAVFGKWHIGARNADPMHPNSFGIDHYAGNLQEANLPSYFDWTLTTNGERTRETGYHSSTITDKAIDWIVAQEDKWLAWVAYSAPHGPFHLPPQDLHTQQLSGSADDIDRNRRAYYLAAIEAMDTEIAQAGTDAKATDRVAKTSYVSVSARPVRVSS